ncbi:MAG: MBL fold metallo-hydrolase [Lachnospiraceae bacterium]|nr:MBL fold metallo-hydrolase [Lachnospiraceae bacterium]
MKRFFRFLIIPFIIVALSIGILSPVCTNVKAENDPENKQDDFESSFWVKFIDVKQGDSALIQCDGHYMLIDGGPTSASSVLYAILKRDRIATLDCIIATHPDADHIGGLSGALNYSKTPLCYSPVADHETKAFRNLVKYLNKKQGELLVPEAGTSFELGSATVEFLGPIAQGNSTNDNSIVARILYGETSFLFMGDAGKSEENSLIRAGLNLSCDVLKVSHHGSKGATSSKFLKEAKPRYAVISTARDNAYGHPSKEALSRLKKADVELFRTDLQGDIFCESDGRNLNFSTQRDSIEDLFRPGSISDDESGENSVALIDGGDDIPDGTTYVLNTNTYRFHLPECSSVKDILPKNKAYTKASVEELIEAGYKPCGNCKP